MLSEKGKIRVKRGDKLEGSGQRKEKKNEAKKERRKTGGDGYNEIREEEGAFFSDVRTHEGLSENCHTFKLHHDSSVVISSPSLAQLTSSVADSLPSLSRHIPSHVPSRARKQI
jgi:hypothetical protein